MVKENGAFASSFFLNTDAASNGVCLGRCNDSLFYALRKLVCIDFHLQTERTAPDVRETFRLACLAFASIYFQIGYSFAVGPSFSFTHSLFRNYFCSCQLVYTPYILFEDFKKRGKLNKLCMPYLTNEIYELTFHTLKSGKLDVDDLPAPVFHAIPCQIFFLPDYFPGSFHFALLPTIMHFQGAGLTTTGDSARVGKEIGMPLSLAPCIRPHMFILVNVNRFPQTLLV